jgi:hypothetical protein
VSDSEYSVTIYSSSEAEETSMIEESKESQSDVTVESPTEYSDTEDDFGDVDDD